MDISAFEIWFYKFSKTIYNIILNIYVLTYCKKNKIINLIDVKIYQVSRYHLLWQWISGFRVNAQALRYITQHTSCVLLSKSRILLKNSVHCINRCMYFLCYIKPTTLFPIRNFRNNSIGHLLTSSFVVFS